MLRPPIYFGIVSIGPQQIPTTPGLDDLPPRERRWSVGTLGAVADPTAQSWTIHDHPFLGVPSGN